MNRAAAPLDELNLGWQSQAPEPDAAADSDDSFVSNSEEEIVLSSDTKSRECSQASELDQPAATATKPARATARAAGNLADILRRVNKPNVRYRAGLSRKVNIESLHANIKYQTK